MRSLRDNEQIAVCIPWMLFFVLMLLLCYIWPGVGTLTPEEIAYNKIENIIQPPVISSGWQIFAIIFSLGGLFIFGSYLVAILIKKNDDRKAGITEDAVVHFTITRFFEIFRTRIWPVLVNDNTAKLKKNRGFKHHIRYYTVVLVLIVWIIIFPEAPFMVLNFILLLVLVPFFGIKHQDNVYKILLWAIIVSLVFNFGFYSFKRSYPKLYYSYRHWGRSVETKTSTNMYEPDNMIDIAYGAMVDQVKRLEAKAKEFRSLGQVDSAFHCVELARELQENYKKAVEGKKSASSNTLTPNQVQPVQQPSPQPLVYQRVVNIQQFKKQVGDTAIYQFDLNENQITTDIALVDGKNQKYSWRVHTSTRCIKTNAEGEPITWDKTISNYWRPHLTLEGVPGQGKAAVTLKIYPYI